jgi:hypothetical protein
MSGTTYFRGFTLALALALAACATTPQPAPLTTKSLIDNMHAAPRATEQTCAAANMALVCSSTSFSRARKSGLSDATCGCADRSEAKLSTWH